MGSRFASATESRYAPVEGEALAVADALEKAQYFVLGCNDLVIAVDNKPLLKIFGNRSLENIPNARLRNLKVKSLCYKFKMLYVPGAKHRAADAMSRHSSGDAGTTVLIDDIAYIWWYTSGSDVLCLPSFTYSSNEIQTSDFVCDDTDVAALYFSAMNAITNLECVTWDKVRTANPGDVDMHRLVETIESGMPDKRTFL